MSSPPPLPPKHPRHSLSLQRPIKPTPSLLKEEDAESASSYEKPTEYETFLSELEKGASVQFRNVLNILTTDSELQPLILDHRKLLLSLKTSDVKAEQMLAIISAAESEMYESSKELEEKQALITQLQLEREENERLNQKLKTIEEEESKSRRVSRIEHQEIMQLRALLGIEEEPAGEDESVGSSFHRSVVAAVEALKEEVKESEARADHLREKMKELAQFRQASISSLEEKLKKVELREEQKNQQILSLQNEVEQLQDKVKELSTELQAVVFQRQHLLEELENQQQHIRGITGGTGSFLQHFEDLHQELSVCSSLLPEATVPTPQTNSEEMKEELMPDFDDGSLEQIPAPPPLRGLAFKRSVPNSVRRSGSPVYLPHPPLKTPSPRHQLSKENISSNRPLGMGSYWTEQRAGNKELEQIISSQSNQLIAASYELDKIGRQRYYEAKLSEQKYYYSEQQARHLEGKVAMLQEENVELKLKLKEARAEHQEELKKASQQIRMELEGQKESSLEALYKQIFQLKERGISLKQRLNQERQMRVESQERLSRSQEESNLL